MGFAVYKIGYNHHSSIPELSRVNNLSRLSRNDLVLVNRWPHKKDCADIGAFIESAKPEMAMLAKSLKEATHLRDLSVTEIISSIGFIEEFKLPTLDEADRNKEYNGLVILRNECFLGDPVYVEFATFEKPRDLYAERQAVKKKPVEKFYDTLTDIYEQAPDTLEVEVTGPVKDQPITVGVKVYNTSGHELPAYATEGAAGFDLRAHLVDGPIQIEPGKIAFIPTGLHTELPVGTQLKVVSRSGLAKKYRIIVLDAPGIVDSDYRGDLMILLWNTGDDTFTVNDGDRIAQAILMPYYKVEWQEVKQHSDLSKTKRGRGGFGSTGL